MPGRPTIDNDASKFLQVLEDSGGGCGNVSLRSALGWTSERYWRTHAILIDEGLIEKGKGKGGSVKSSQLSPTLEKMGKKQPPTTLEVVKEIQLYEPVEKVIRENWVPARHYDQHIVEITASPKKQSAAGAWTQPDISVLGTKSYPFFPGKFFEIVTFEIKKEDAVDVKAVFEALSHAQFATFAFVVFHIGDQKLEGVPNVDRLTEIATRHGVGILTASDIEKFETWDEVVHPKRFDPDPEQSNRFIARSFTEQAKNTVVKWHK